MSLVQVTAPGAYDAVSFAQVVRALRLPDSEEFGDPVHHLELVLQAAIAKLDGKDGLLGRALGTQSWRLELPCFPTAIALPLPPFQAVSSFTYVDTAGVTQTLSASEYRATGTDPCVLLPPRQEDWPSTLDDTPDAVQVTYSCGYGSSVPEPIQSAILMLCGHLYEHREAILVATNANVLPLGVDYLIAPYRQWDFS